MNNFTTAFLFTSILVSTIILQAQKLNLKLNKIEFHIRK